MTRSKSWKVTLLHILFWVGIAGIVVSLILIGKGLPALGSNEDLGNYLFIGSILLFISFLVALPGALMLLGDRIDERRFLNSFDKRESNSDNDTVKKL